MEGVTGALVVQGPSPAVVDVGAATSADTVARGLADLGIGPEDLAWIVLTHVHLDHCGASGALAARFPRARVVVHRRGVKHLVDPTRLVAASAEVYGPLAPLYGGLEPIPADRIDEAPDGHVVDLGGGRRLRMIETLGHARHHMSVLEESTGTLAAGDALGVRFGDGGPYLAAPPADVDVERWIASVDRIEEIAPERVFVAHFGEIGDPAHHVARVRDQLERSAVAARSTLPDPTPERVGRALEIAVPIASEVGDDDAVARWRELRWDVANHDGFALWAQRIGEREGSAAT